MKEYSIKTTKSLVIFEYFEDRRFRCLAKLIDGGIYTIRDWSTGRDPKENQKYIIDQLNAYKHSL